MALMRSKKITGPYEECDVALVGGGIVSATFGLFLSMLQPDWSIRTFERLGRTALESSDPWNNAGTGHAALCELNYTTERADGTIDASKAFAINEQFQVSRQLWAHLVREGILGTPSEFINKTPHMSFVRGEKNGEFLRKRYETLKEHPLFGSQQFSTDHDQIAEWAPLLIDGRPQTELVSATYDQTGTDVNFGSLTRQYFAQITKTSGQVETEHEVIDLKRASDGGWLLKVHDLKADVVKLVKARVVFDGAGGYALSVLQKAGLPEVDGYGLFPVSGLFLNTREHDIVSRHNAKVYGLASVGAPPMSVPHLDARVIDGTKVVLFGPFAGLIPKYLIRGSFLDVPASLRPHNIKPMVDVGLTNFDLITYLVKELTKSKKATQEELQAFAPNANLEDWKMTKAGQRAQIIKKDPNGKGILQFGTEAVVSADRSMGGLLGASPGASIAAPVLLGVLERMFPEKVDEWLPKIKEIIPSYGTKLADDPARAHEVMSDTAAALDINPPL